jgi:hypothetical protein
LIGLWAPAAAGDRDGKRIAHDYSWTVGGKAVRIRENYSLGNPDAAELDGMVLWNPATETGSLPRERARRGHRATRRALGSIS